MGHKRIENTLIYTHLIRFSDEEYVSAVASTIDEARRLVEAGFEYVTEIDEIKIFKKRK
jgi:predicted RNase H-like HicB family nuclease